MADIVKIPTPVFRLCFPTLFVPEAFEEGKEPKYGMTPVWTPAKFGPNDRKRWEHLKKHIDEKTMAAFGQKSVDLPGNYKRGIRNGNEKADLEGFGEGTFFASVTSKMRPGVISTEKGDDGKFLPISPEEGNADLIYPGCYCRATVNVYTYDNKSKGYALGLFNVQKVADGERLDTRTDASDDFADSELDDGWLDQVDEGDTSGEVGF